jgi:hypothetical protein
MARWRESVLVRLEIETLTDVRLSAAGFERIARRRPAKKAGSAGPAGSPRPALAGGLLKQLCRQRCPPELRDDPGLFGRYGGGGRVSFDDAWAEEGIALGLATRGAATLPGGLTLKTALRVAEPRKGEVTALLEALCRIPGQSVMETVDGGEVHSFGWVRGRIVAVERWQLLACSPSFRKVLAPKRKVYPPSAFSASIAKSSSR